MHACSSSDMMTGFQSTVHSQSCANVDVQTLFGPLVAAMLHSIYFKHAGEHARIFLFGVFAGQVVPSS